MSEKPAGYPYKCRLRKAPEWRLLLRPPVDENPRLLGAETKGLILVALALCASSTGFSSTSYFPGNYILFMLLLNIFDQHFLLILMFIYKVFRLSLLTYTQLPC